METNNQTSEQEVFAPVSGWTAPRDIQPDVARKIIAARDALFESDIMEAIHQLYSIACPNFDSFHPWDELEKQSNTQ